MNRMTDAEVHDLIGEGMRRRILSEAEAAAWMTRLIPHKAFRVLSYYAHTPQAGVFRSLVATDLMAAVRILRQSRESDSEPESCRGAAAASLLSDLTRGETALLLTLLAFFDFDFAKAVQNHCIGDAGLVCESERTSEMTNGTPEPMASGLFAPPSGYPVLDRLEVEETVVVPMRGYALATTADRRVLLTFDVATCVVLSLHDPVSGTAVLAHVDVWSDLQDSLDRIVSDLRDLGLEPASFLARVVGGRQLSEESVRLIRDLVDRVEKEGMTVLSADPGNQPKASRAFALDAASGVLFEYTGPILPADRRIQDSHHHSTLERVVP